MCRMVVALENASFWARYLLDGFYHRDLLRINALHNFQEQIQGFYSGKVS